MRWTASEQQKAAGTMLHTKSCGVQAISRSAACWLMHAHKIKANTPCSEVWAAIHDGLERGVLIGIGIGEKDAIDSYIVETTDDCQHLKTVIFPTVGSFIHALRESWRERGVDEASLPDQS